MTKLSSIATAVFRLALAAAVVAGVWWLLTNKPVAAKGEKPPPAATVAKPVSEEKLNTVVLTEQAEARLGVVLGAVVKKPVPRARVYGAEVIVPAGKTVIVSAPVSGTLKAPAGGLPLIGQEVRQNQPMLQLLPLLTPEGRTAIASQLVDAEGQVKSAQTQVDATRIALDRAKRLLKEEAGSRRAVDESQAAFDLAGKALDAATARQTLLTRLVGEADTAGAPLISLGAPEDGMLRSMAALPGQNVPAGAVLFEVVDLSTVWVRVPLPVDDLLDVDRLAPAMIGKLSAPPGEALKSARPITAPPAANALAATVDLFYEVPNADRSLIPGQRAGASLVLAGQAESLVVPWSSVVFDIYGGAWVYEQTEARTYVRRRVVVRHVVKTDAVLEKGPAVGAKIVTEGAIEIFGAETGFSK
jgi:membrane fusion protein, heavy metal efflux system